MNAWTITVDHFADPSAAPGTNSNAAGVTGPRGNRLTTEQIISHPDAKQFRMFDDDSVLYYEGSLIGDEFAPLDDFGGPNAGCTAIQVFENNVWTWV